MAIPLDQILIQTLNGIVTGMILALVASGLTLIFGIMDVVNFAHGELFMLGAYVGVLTLAATGNFWLALVGRQRSSSRCSARLIYLTTLRPLIGRDPLTTILATFGVSLVLQNYALWQFGPVARKIPEPFTGHFTLFYLEYPWYRLVIAGLSAAIIGGLLAVPQIRHLRHLDPRHDAGPGDGAGDGHPGAVGADRRLRDRLRRWRRRAACCSPRSSASNSSMGVELDPAGLHRRRGRRHGQPRRLDRRGDLHQPPRSLCLAVGQPVAGGHRLVRRADPDPAVPADRAVRADPEMSERRGTRLSGRGSPSILALLIVAPLVLPEFWRRFVTEILIWGLLAMSSDLLIGYTGMVSFGHSAFFGLGMYGAAAALLTVARRPICGWRCCSG